MARSVPTPTQLVNGARNANSIITYLAGGVAGVAMALVYLFLAPIQAVAAGLYDFALDFITQAGGLFTDGIIGNTNDLLGAGARGTAEFLRGEPYGFVLAFVLVLMAAWIFNLWQQATDTDIPFLGDIIPFWGGGEE